MAKKSHTHKGEPHDHHDHGPSCGCGHDHEHGEESPKVMLVRILLSLVLLVVFCLLPVCGLWRLPLFLIPYLIAGYDVLKRAGENLFRGHVLDEAFLMALATVGALAIGEYPEAVFVMVFYQIGELFQDRAVDRSRDSIAALMDLCPDTAHVEGESGLETADPRTLQPGTVLVVKPGERVPLDGVILSGTSSLNTAALTGESLPRAVGEGDAVLSGCVNGEGLLRVSVTKAYEDSTVARILDMIDHAARGKAKSEKWITRFARYYTPVVVLCALALAILPPLILGGWAVWLNRALVFLVVSCPCALVISVPLTFYCGIGGASRKGILIKGSQYLEALARCGTAVFDKTGTLTNGAFQVSGVFPADGTTEEELLTLAASAERYSTHPIAQSLREAAGERGERSAVEETEVLPGKGVRAVVNGKAVWVGNLRLLSDLGLQGEDRPGTVVLVAAEGRYLGCLTISDRCKADAAETVQGLKALGVGQCVLLTGDSESAAGEVARALGMDRYRASLLPDQKVTEVEALLQEGKGSLLYVGDGINDAPVLTLADVGIAMGAFGSDAAIEAADVVLMEDRPSGVCAAVRLARRTMEIVRQNVVLSIGVKLAVMVLGGLGLAGLWAAVFADVGVCVLCVLNGMRAMG